MDFAHFWTAYEDVVKKARGGKLTVEDFPGTTISLTNPGTIGTVHSVPRLMQGQGTIIGVGAMEYPAEWHGASLETLDRLAVSKILTLTSTYDHRIIQGAQSGDFLRVVHSQLLGEDGFYDEIFESLRIPYEPIRWVRDVDSVARRRHQQDRPGAGADPRLPRARSPDGRHRPAGVQAAPPPRPRRHHPRPDPVGPGPRVRHRRVRRQAGHEAAQDPRRAARLLLPHRRRRVHAHPGPRAARLDAGPDRGRLRQDHRATEQLRILRRLNAAEAFETFLQTKFVGQKRFSLEGGETVIPLLDRDPVAAPRATTSTRSASGCRTAAGSTCWPTSRARATARSSASSRARRTRSRCRAPAT